MPPLPYLREPCLHLLLKCRCMWFVLAESYLILLCFVRGSSERKLFNFQASKILTLKKSKNVAETKAKKFNECDFFIIKTIFVYTLIFFEWISENTVKIKIKKYIFWITNIETNQKCAAIVKLFQNKTGFFVQIISFVFSFAPIYGIFGSISFLIMSKQRYVQTWMFLEEIFFNQKHVLYFRKRQSYTTRVSLQLLCFMAIADTISLASLLLMLCTQFLGIENEYTMDLICKVSI